jgi:hypothetical protein
MFFADEDQNLQYLPPQVPRDSTCFLGTQTWYGVEAEGNEPQAGTPSPAPSPALFFPSLPWRKKLFKKTYFLLCF